MYKPCQLEHWSNGHDNSIAEHCNILQVSQDVQKYHKKPPQKNHTPLFLYVRISHQSYIIDPV